MSRLVVSRGIRELTPAGRGGVSVLEVTGADALERVRGLAPGAGLEVGGLRTLVLHHQGDGQQGDGHQGDEHEGDELDEALVWVESEERVELHLHGSPAVVEDVRAALSRGTRGGGAEATETPSRPSLEEAAERRLRDAPSESAARVLLDQTEGALRRELAAVLAASAGGHVEGLRARLEELVARGRVARRLLRPPRVVLAGPVNAGKSTLFNVLVGRERTIAHPESGTTRDAVRERVLLSGYAVDLVDAAGERPLAADDPANRVERAGQELAESLRETADLVLWLAPRGEGAGDLPARRPDGPPTVVLASRADEMGEGAARGLAALSAKEDPRAALRAVELAFLEALELPATAWEPGAGVPFLEEDHALLEALSRPGTAPARIRLELETMLSR